METVNFEDFAKIEIRIGKVLEAETVEGSDKLIKTKVDFGRPDGKVQGLGIRTIVSGIRQWYEPEELIGKFLPYVVNLEPRKIMGIESQGMLLAAAPIDDEGNNAAVLMEIEKDVEPGTKVV